MQNIEMIRMQLNHLVTQARYDIYMLSTLNDPSMKQQILQRLWETLSAIHFLSESLASQAMTNNHLSPSQQAIPAGMMNQTQIPPITPAPNTAQSNQRPFTLGELATFTGKNGRPAYVAVNGIVYDVTNNRAWAAATHFGLIAGKDYTQEFASCHTGQQSILATLPVVGRLV
ncbi:cytochrome b5 domain-containing protein [Sporosarcina pasteurii]|uniref:Predicted heme/steroid binding protein n=1 Tax=Sporosarcina pasteurii TaxID=1474 RepID=A0A380BM38_SPOPA|nr:cytochrome b5 domain-containing protein [Sporosarcina pasteurii]MDS9470959.1 cytochrome b5 domain-containing protein [Sporosarcina pasteurii]SUJ03458.1 Predicted heme/steroid binding protein [Sporosarcina pasteurii]